MTQPFNKAPCLETTAAYIQEALAGRVSGDGPFTKRCSEWMERTFSAPKVLLTTSGTHALEMAAVLCAVQPGDEVIMPSYTFSSTANAFVQRGATIVFIDIRPDTMNMDEALLEDAITDQTRVVVPMHYAGVACEMGAINEIAGRRGLRVVEDAAQGVMATYKGRALGTLSDFGCYSFHETKNYSMGEGGALLLNCPGCNEAAEIIREKGTDRSRFFRGEVDKYSWVNWGSSYLPSELNAACLWSQLECAEAINEDRLASWRHYYKGLAPLAARGSIELPAVPAHCKHNGHMFYIKTANLDERTRLIRHLKDNDVSAVYHYVPLHSAPAGLRYGRFHGEDRFTTTESERLLRLPIYYGIAPDAIERTVGLIGQFYRT